MNLTKNRLNEMIDRAIKDGQDRPHAMQQTNVLNAEYAAGKVTALLEVLEELYGLDAFIEAAQRTQSDRTALIQRTQAIYR